MAPKIYLSLAFHNHQPVGNFGWVFEEGYNVAYLPMIECLERHPNIRLALHYTGPLRDWLVENRPDFFPRVRALVARGQVEIMSGGYYEPVLASLPDVDKIGQIRKMTDSVRDDFGYEATGAWLAERVWEPHLPSSLVEAGIDYTIVDDTHFKAVGYSDEDLLGYYVTEERGRTLKVFATSMPLRYTIPWSPVADVIGWLLQQAEAPNGRYLGRAKVAVMGDDGEKFGMWPGTYEHVWANGWMDRFFEAIEANGDWLATVAPGDFAKEKLSLGRIYLPTSSYQEMGEWVLPPDSAYEISHLRHQLEAEKRPELTKYMRGGLWRQFMVKYDEVNQMHKKAVWVSRKVHAMPEGEAKDQALDALWAGQCNCGYWHGVFGGIYLFHIRQADYQEIIKAENLADGIGAGGNKPFVHADVVDFDADAIDEVILTSDRQTLIFDLAEGGGVTEWDFRPAEYNLGNVMTRRREGYHKDLRDAAEAGRVVLAGSEAGGDAPDSIHSEVVRVLEPDLHTKLIYDWYRRANFLDHFIPAEARLDGFYRSDFGELGDFVNQVYDHELEALPGGGQALTLRRDGGVWQGSDLRPVTITKRFELLPGSDTLRVKYSVTNSGEGALDCRFGVETSWGFAGGNDDHTFVEIGAERYSLGEIAENAGVDDLTITSHLWKQAVKVSADREASVWRFPLETISASEAGYECNYQGTTFLHWWTLQLTAGESWEIGFEIRLNQL